MMREGLRAAALRKKDVDVGLRADAAVSFAPPRLGVGIPARGKECEAAGDDLLAFAHDAERSEGDASSLHAGQRDCTDVRWGHRG